MIAGVAFDLYRPLFTAGKLADLCGVKRPVIDTMATRGFIRASGREQPATPRRQSATKGKRPPAPKGRPLFSARDVFKVRLMRVLAAQLDLAFPESKVMAVWAEEPVRSSKKRLQSTKLQYRNLQTLPPTRASGCGFLLEPLRGESPLTSTPMRRDPEASGNSTCTSKVRASRSPMSRRASVGKSRTFFVPVGEIFIAVYNDCKKSLGITDQTMAGEDV